MVRKNHKTCQKEAEEKSKKMVEENRQKFLAEQKLLRYTNKAKDAYCISR